MLLESLLCSCLGKEGDLSVGGKRTERITTSPPNCYFSPPISCANKIVLIILIEIYYYARESYVYSYTVKWARGKTYIPECQILTTWSKLSRNGT